MHKYFTTYDCSANVTVCLSDDLGIADKQEFPQPLHLYSFAFPGTHCISSVLNVSHKYRIHSQVDNLTVTVKNSKMDGR